MALHRFLRSMAHRHFFLAAMLAASLISLVPMMALSQTTDTGSEPAAVESSDPGASTSATSPPVTPESGLSAEVLDPNIDELELEHRLVPMTKQELAALAERWLKIVKHATEEVMRMQIAIDRTGGTMEALARDQLTEVAGKRKALFDKYSAVLAAWEKKGGDPDAIAEYRAYRTAIIVEETRTADTRTLIAQALYWLTDRNGGIKLATHAAIILASLIGLLFAARIVRRLARRWIGHVPNLSMLLQAFLVTVIYWIVLTMGLMIVLSALGIDISPIFALIGGASFILGFAFQDTLGNLASGLMIMINRPFDVGHYVDVGGVAGTVKSVSIVATTVNTPDNQIIVIPNKNVWGNIITNVTASDTRRVDLVFGISYEDSIPEAHRVLAEVVAAHELILAEPEPVIRVHELADSSVNFVCRPWTRTSDYWTVYWDLTQQVKQAFDAAGISIPYPQRDVHVKHGTLSAEPALKFNEQGESNSPAGSVDENRNTGLAAAVSEGEDGAADPREGT